jgi:hypothetical protein
VDGSAQKWERPYVKVMASRPPPAPANACAMLSLCWATEVDGTDCGAFGSVVGVDMMLKVEQKVSGYWNDGLCLH